MNTPPQGPDTANRRLTESLLSALAGMSSSYFGIVMATGIVSLAAHLMGMSRIAHALFILNVALYLGLWCLTLLRLVRFPRQFLADMTDHRRGPGFFTVVAATSVLGGQFVSLKADFGIGLFLWGLAIALWIVLNYTIFAGLAIREEKPSLDKGISGSWLLAVVATQSIAVLSALLATQASPIWKIEINFLALSMWLWGGMLYIWLTTLIFYRYMFLRLEPDDLTPPYWINMGAMAISTFAGSLLIINAPDAPFLVSLAPFIKGITALYWATGTWWIPMLIILMVWRYLIKRFPVRYDPQYWAAVFPLGMYTVGTHLMTTAMHFGFLDVVPKIFFYVALCAWTITFIAFVTDLIRRLLPGLRHQRTSD